MVKKQKIVQKPKSQTPKDIDDVSFLFKMRAQDIKLSTNAGKSFTGNRTKHWESLSFALNFDEFSCTVTRFDYWFKGAPNQQYCHERRHQVKWDYRGDKHSIGSYDIGPLTPLLGDERPKRAGVIFTQVSAIYNQKKR